MKIRLQRTVARRSAPDVAKRLLVGKLQRIFVGRFRLRLTKVHVEQRSTGHYAELETSEGVSEEYFTKVLDHLRISLSAHFDPPWVVMEEGQEPAPADIVEGPDTVDTIPPAIERPIGTINLDLPEDTFSRIYGRESQIRRIVDAISVGKDTNWLKRKHTLLSGPPGCGKTETMLTLAHALGKEGESWIWFDATSTSKAGAIESLMKAPVLPPILFVEEIEKVQESSLRWLLSVMDERGEIRRTNYRVGSQVKSARLTIIATANNVDILRAMDSSALYSRFGNRIHFPSPDREVMEKILTREITEINGNQQWVNETLNFGFDKMGIRDSREILNILLCGRDRLLTGEYQRDYLNTIPPQDRKDLKLAE